MRILFALSFVLFFVTSSIGQSFTLPELIKMSKMNVDDFDTYVSAKGYTFYNKIDKVEIQGVTYAYNIDIHRGKATKFITLFQRYFSFYMYALQYQTLDQKEYLKIKNQIKASGFILQDNGAFNSEDGGVAKNEFVYRKGKAKITISVDFERFNFRYHVYN